MQSSAFSYKTNQPHMFLLSWYYKQNRIQFWDLHLCRMWTSVCQEKGEQKCGQDIGILLIMDLRIH